MKTIKQLFMLVALMCTATSAWATKQAYVVFMDNYEGGIEVRYMKHVIDPLTNEETNEEVVEQRPSLTMTFYYDEEMYSHTYMYQYNIGGGYPEWRINQMDNYDSEIVRQATTRVQFDPSFADFLPTSCEQWFNGFFNLHTITGIEYLNTSQVTSMYGMFDICRKLTTLDVSHFNTSNVENMGYMFDDCVKLTTLDLRNFDTSSVTNMEFMFSGCSNLTELDLGNFNTSKVTYMQYMFGYCTNLQKIYVGDGWDTSKVTSSNYMFSGCNNLVGENGTTYNSSYGDKAYARIDAEGTPGYLTLRNHPCAYFYYEGEMLFVLSASKTDGTVALPTAFDLLNNYYLKNASYTYSGSAFTAETVITEDVDVTINATSLLNPYTTIGDDATNYSDYPYYTLEQYSTSQTIYEATEMNGAATIRGIAFKVRYDGNLPTTSVDIYLGHRASTTFSSNFGDHMTEANLTHVYHGSPTLATKTGWEKIKFNLANFDYNGTDNLVVVVCRKADSYVSSSSYYCENKINHVIYRGDDYSSSYGTINTSSTSYYTSDLRPCAQFLTLNFSAQGVELTDADGYTITKNTEVASATYKKTLEDERVGKYQAWFVPFDYAITTTDLGKFDFFKINMIANAGQPGENPASDDVYIFLNPITTAGTTLKGNMPYVYRPKEAVTNYPFTTEFATLLPKNTSSLLQTSTTTATYDFYGTYADTEAATAGPFYYVNINGQISYGTTVTVGPYRWILKATAKGGVNYAPKLVFSEGDPTGISEVQDSGFKVQGSEAFYNLNGQRVSQPTKGLYIVNGRKVVVK